MTAAASKPADIRTTLDAFLTAVHGASQEAAHGKPKPLADVARELGIPEALAIKVAVFLESEGLIEYDEQAVDITIAGMLEVEAGKRVGDRKPAPPDKDD